MKQRIVVEIDGGDLPPYELDELKGKDKHPYPAMRHFFEDIGYKVTKLELTPIEEQTNG